MLRFIIIFLPLIFLACPVDDAPQPSVDGVKDAGSSGETPAGSALDAGVEELDSGTEEQTITTIDAGSGAGEIATGSEDVEAICVELEAPDGGFPGIGLVSAVRGGSRVSVTVTLFNVNCGIMSFNLFMAEAENDEVLTVRVSPAGLLIDIDMARCHCDMDLTAEFLDEDESLQRVKATYYSEWVLDNPDAMPANGVIGEAVIQ